VEPVVKVYISCHHPDPANSLAALLKANGHEIVSTWHAETTPRPASDGATAWQVKADANIDRIRATDALVCIASPEHVSRAKCVPGGKFVEAGAAVMASKLVFTLGGIENGMLYAAQVRHAKDVADLLSLLLVAE
jgi:hypothetical protein